MITHARRYSVIAAAVLLAILLTPANIFSCGPFFQEPVFTSPDGPDQPLELFVKGRLGIVLPWYETNYLVIAYRYLAGTPLSAAEEGTLIAAWTPDIPRPGGSPPEQPATDLWQKARQAALGPAQTMASNATLNQFRAVAHGWQMYANCGDDAFSTAAKTVTSLAKTYGAGSEPVRDWVDAQDIVFKNCGEVHGELSSAAAPLLPKPATIQNAVLRMDRDYQIAAANFYAGNWPTAAQQFQQIADNRESPWQTWAPYLVARCYIRQATLGSSGESSAKPPDSEGSSFNVQDMTAAEKQLQSILKNPALNTIHPAAQRLLNYVEARLHPDQRLHQVALQLEGKAPTSDFQQDLIDFHWLMNHSKAPGVDAAESPDELAQRGLLDDLTDWVSTFSGSMYSPPSPELLAHAVQRWRTTKSTPWLIAALSHVPASDPNASALADAAAALAPSSPAYEMAVYHRARLLIEEKKQQAARQLLDANLSRFEEVPVSGLNLLLAQRFALATDYHQFLEFAPRTPVELSWDMDGGPDESASKPLPKRFDSDSVGIINQRLPLTMLTQAATGDVLPSDLRGVLATATWVRAALLNDPQTAKILEPVAVTAHPELREHFNAYDTATTKEARAFSAIWTMLHIPGMRPFVSPGPLRTAKFADVDPYRDNWWCADMGAKQNASDFVSYQPWMPAPYQQQQPAAPASPSFLSASERMDAQREWQQLSSVGAAPNYFGRVVLQWAKGNANDERVPEALHLVVTRGRLGCTTEQTASLSKQAFDLLHTRYPDSPWTKKTPYWFK